MIVNEDNNNVRGYLVEAYHLFQQGRLEEAEVATLNILKIYQDNAEANHLLGIIAIQREQYDLACKYITRATQVNPKYIEAYFNLGAVLKILGQNMDALRAFDHAILLKPDYVAAYCNRGALLLDSGRLDEALAAYDMAIQLNPELVDAHVNRSGILRCMGRKDEALASCKKVIQLNPFLAGAHNNYGLSLCDLGQLDHALKVFNRAIELMPDYSEAHYNLGNTLRDLGRQKEALSAYERAINLQSRYTEAYINLGNLFWRMGRLVDALDTFERLIEFKQRNVVAYNSLGLIHWELGRLDEAEHSFRRALELDPGNAGANSNLISMHAATARLSSHQLLDEQRNWDNIHGNNGRKNRYRPHPVTPINTRRLRIGYVSPDFCTHAVSYFFEPILTSHDRTRFEIFCYDANNKIGDATTERLRKVSEHWCFVSDLDNGQLAEIIYSDCIDILVDLAGHTRENRLKAFTYKPAPVQATYLGYFAATGLESIDYWITDEVAHPLDTIESTVESIYRLPRCSLCYQPSPDMPAVSACPSVDHNVIFGSFSNLSKLTPETIETWSRLLLELPGSRLLLTTRPLGDPKTRELLVDRFAQCGIPQERLGMYSAPESRDWLATYAKVDIVLDPFPRTGTTTTAEAIWMGVPVITLAGQRYASRASAIVLTAADLAEFITHSPDEYIGKALSLARDPKKRIKMRKIQRNVIANSPLCDRNALTTTIENAYKAMWEHYISTQSV